MNFYSSPSHEIVNVNLVKKPDWFSQRTPTGVVPVLEHGDGRIVYESLIISEYLDALYPENRLTPTDPFVKSQHQFLIEMSSKITKAFYKLIKQRDIESISALNKALDYFESKLQDDFFGGIQVFVHLGLNENLLFISKKANEKQ
jgi:glutathione S-transferase